VTKQSSFKAVQSLSFHLVLPYPLQQNIRVDFHLVQDIRVGARNPDSEREKRAKGKAFIYAILPQLAAS